MKRPIRIQVWVSETDGLPRVRIKAGNNKIIFTSEAYEGGRAKADHAVELVTREIAAGNYIVESDGPVPRSRRRIWRNK